MKLVKYVNSTKHQIDWWPSPGNGWISPASTNDWSIGYHTEMNIKCVGFELHVAFYNPKLKRFTRVHLWDKKKGKFVCHRHRDYVRQQKRIALLQSLKQDLAIAQS